MRLHLNDLALNLSRQVRGRPVPAKLDDATYERVIKRYQKMANPLATKIRSGGTVVIKQAR